LAGIITTTKQPIINAMKILTDWGFTLEGWRNGKRGEYLVLLQGLLLIGFILLPIYRLPELKIKSILLLYISWGISTLLSSVGLIFIVKGLLDLGKNLTPLPYPKEDGELVQTGVYKIVRHPLYSGIILVAIAWTVFQFSLFHFIGSAVLFVFFDIKANQEETWLNEKYPDYSDYRQQVKKLLPWVY
jgi:protein-S-isoprenylcysteine O-methyltransferase Ste14